jgi:hypothetical protein
MADVAFARHSEEELELEKRSLEFALVQDQKRTDALDAERAALDRQAGEVAARIDRARQSLLLISAKRLFTNDEFVALHHSPPGAGECPDRVWYKCWLRELVTMRSEVDSFKNSGIDFTIENRTAARVNIQINEDVHLRLSVTCKQDPRFRSTAQYDMDAIDLNDATRAHFSSFFTKSNARRARRPFLVDKLLREYGASYFLTTLLLTIKMMPAGALPLLQ